MNPLTRNLCAAAYSAVHAGALQSTNPHHQAIIEASAAWLIEETRAVSEPAFIEVTLQAYELAALIISAHQQGSSS